MFCDKLLLPSINTEMVTSKGDEYKYSDERDGISEALNKVLFELLVVFGSEGTGSKHTVTIIEPEDQRSTKGMDEDT